jgi:FkbH-like protein
MYLQESIRKKSSSSFKSIDDYLQSLELRLKVTHDDIALIERGAQMSQKTNQFNLRTKRYTESEISKFVSSPKTLISNFSLDDKYGDYGVTGLAILSLEKDEAFIDTFLMSCRVIGRNVEFSFFSAIVMQLAALRPDIKIIKGEWIKSMKNQQVKNFYDELGFECTSDGGEYRKYSLILASFTSKAKDYIKF